MLTILRRGNKQTSRIVVIAVLVFLWLDLALGQAATHTDSNQGINNRFYRLLQKPGE